MDKHCLTILNEFILMEITDCPQLQIPLFGLFFLVYMVSVVGNLGLIILTMIDSRLQKPKYFFLRHLASTILVIQQLWDPKCYLIFLQINIKSTFIVVLPNLLSSVCLSLVNFSFCQQWPMIAMWLSVTFCCIQSSCQKKACHLLVVITYLHSVFVSLLTIIKSFLSSFCGYNVIRNFYCDSLPLISLLCSNTHDIKLIILFFSAFNLVSSLLIVFVSYMLILTSIIMMKSAKGRHKAFSTCRSHLTVVVPMIYGLRNKEVKESLENMCKCSLQNSV